MRRVVLCCLMLALAALGVRPAAAQGSATITRNEAVSEFGKEVRF